MKSAVIYLRVSTERQANQGFSIPAQREACFEYAKKHGLEVINTYVDDGVSARTLNRPKLREMLDRATQNGDFSFVIVHKIDRIARNTIDHATIKMILRKAKVEMLSATENIDDSPEGQFLEMIMAAMAEYYSSNLGREALKGMNQRAKKGYWNSLAPVGYNNFQVVREDGRILKEVRLDPNYVPIVQHCFQLYSSGRCTIHDISRQLNEEGIVARSGKPFSVSMLAGMLRRKFYIGKIIWNDIEVEGKHEPIIEVKTFERVQKILDAKGGYIEQAKKHFFVLRGLLECGECTAKMTGEQHKTTANNIKRYFDSRAFRARRVSSCGKEIHVLYKTAKKAVLSYTQAIIKKYKNLKFLAHLSQKVGSN